MITPQEVSRPMKKALLSSLLLMAGMVIAAAPAAAVIPTGFSDVVVYGTNSAAFGNGAVVVSGDVVVNDSASAPTLEANRELVAGKDASFPAGYEAKADRLKAHKDTLFGGDVFCNDLSAPQNPVVCSPLALPVFPFLPPFVTGPSSGPDVDVGRDEEIDLAAGDYGDLTLDQYATVRFTGGVYNFRSIDAKKGTAFLFLAPSEVRVAEDIDVDKESTFGPAAGSGVAASEVVVYVAGDGLTGNALKVVTFDSDATIGANFYAPTGTITLGPGSIASGAFVGFNVDVQGGAQVTLDTYFFNRPPVAGDDSATVAEGGTVSTLDSGETSLLANDSDPDGDNLAVTTTPVAFPAHGAVVLNPDGTFTYTHDGSETLSDSFVYEVCDDGTDPGPLCDTATVAITVLPVNDPPVANPDSATVDEGGTVTVLDGGAASVLANDTDAENGVLTASVVSGPANASAFSLNPDGTFSYTHDGSETTSDSFVYQACDDGTPVECDTATVAITVEPVNDPPVAADDSATVDEGGTVTVLDGGATSVLANDVDPDGPSLTATLTGGLNEAAAFTLNPDGTFSYTHDGGESTADFFTYEVCDNGTPNLCDDARVDIAITQLSSTQADPGSTSTSVDVPVIITLTGVAEPEDLPLVFSIVSPPSNGSVTPPTTVSDTSANVTYSPALGFEGSDQFTFQVEDNKGVTDTAVVTIEVIDESGSETVNAFDVSLTIDEGTPVTVTLSATTTSEDPVTFSIATSPANGSLGPLVPNAFSNTATVDYTPNAGFTGVDSFTYDACITAGCDTGTVTITVRPVAITVSITKAGDGGGTVSSVPEGIDCGLVCSAGFTGEFPIQLFAEADEGSVFSGWSGDADCADGRLTPNANKSCIATFELEGPPPVGEVTVSVAISGTGTGTVTSSPAGIDCGVVCSAVFDAFTRVELNAVADPSSEFVGWGGTGDCLDGQLNTDRNQSCIAFFDALPTETFTLTVVKLGTGNGTVVSSPSGISCGGDCSEGYVPGTAVRLSTRPDSGSTFLGWGGDCSGTSFFTDVILDADKTCTATYQ